MSHTAAGGLEESVIDLLEGGILMRFPHRQVPVLFIKSSRPQTLEVHIVPHPGMLDGLTAAVYAASGAAHDLHKVVGLLSGANQIQYLLGVAQAGSHRHIHSQGHPADSWLP